MPRMPETLQVSKLTDKFGVVIEDVDLASLDDKGFAEFYGLWTFATRLSAIVGPLTYGLVTWLSGGNHRLAILSTAVFFVVGLVLLRPIDVVRGQAAAGTSSS